MIYKCKDNAEEHEAAYTFDSICKLFAVMKNAETRCKEALERDSMEQYRLNLQIYDGANAVIWELVEPFLDCDGSKSTDVKPTNFNEIIEGYEKQIESLQKDNDALTKVAEAYGLEYCYTVDEFKEMYTPGGRKID